ncbi:lytic transglycosylase domain-containing protein [Chitinophaga japonensis]|uniref:Membrane-bound lytic murein transglycosylase D n=1 Tax=Chitinophaga japonensis TaxID=104662 RepID=A0A562TFT4_CHIJA|nr:lytic transglycosylase domain-containing protein [Chitinophaga japonensis]TWI92365.1 membrane-bound lytic murein transglycosylase D [Chitinophaga japonensis]
MRKVFLLLLLPAIGVLSASAADGNVVSKEMVAPRVAAPDTAILNSDKVRLPKDTIVSYTSTTSAAVKRAAKSLPSSIRSPKVYEQINNNLVAGYINTYATRYSQHLQIMLERGERYFVTIEKIFREHGIPEEMKYLAVIESSFNTNARSRVGAVGAWQFMSGTARLFGLSVSKRVDERRDFYKSTLAAARYLNELYQQFDDWLLVVAAYNCGAGGVQRAMRASGRSDFWGIQYFLPSESRNHVYKFIATGYILDRFNNFFGVGDDDDKKPTVTAAAKVTQPEPAPLTEDDMFNTVEFNITGKYRLEVIARKLDMELAELSRLNPDFAKTMAGPDNSYDLRVPNDKMKQFMNEKDEILKASVQMTLEERTAAADKSKFPPPAKLPAKKEDARAKKDNGTATQKTADAKAKTTAKAKTATAAKTK